MLKLLSPLPLLALLAAPALADSPSSDALYGKWQAESIGGAPVAAGVDSTLQISSDGSIGGRGGCNLYFGKATIEGENISIGDMGSTMMACEDPAMQQERDFLAALESAKSWTLEDSRLVLRDDKGETAARFVPVATITIEIPDATLQSETLLYRCGEQTLPVTYINAGGTSLAVLKMIGAPVVASSVLSASGAKYAGESYIWWIKGSHADLYNLMQGEDAPPLSCEEVQ